MRVEIRDSDTHSVVVVLTESSTPDDFELLAFPLLPAVGDPIRFADAPEKFLAALPEALAGSSRTYAAVVPDEKSSKAKALAEAALATAVGALGIPFKGGTPEYHAAYNKLKNKNKKNALKGLPAATGLEPHEVESIKTKFANKPAAPPPKAAPPPGLVYDPATGLYQSPNFGKSAAQIVAEHEAKAQGGLASAPAPAPTGNMPSSIAPNLTANEVAAIRSYQGSGYSAINGQLRAPGGLANADSNVRNKVIALDSAFKKLPPLEKDVTVRRGVGEEGMNKILAAGEGGVFHEKGYGSTSFGEGFGGSAKMVITVPKGTRALDMNKTLGQKSIHKNEKELLLNRGTKLKITKIEKSPTKMVPSQNLPSNVFGPPKHHEVSENPWQGIKVTIHATVVGEEQ